MLVAAAIDKIIDFRQARFRDPKWRRYVNSMLIGLGQKRREQSLEALQRHHLAVLIAPGFTEDQRNERQGMAISAYEQLQASYQPWLRIDSSKVQNEAKQLTDAYTQIFGDPNTPEVQERINRLAEALKAQTQDRSDYADNPLGLRRKEPRVADRRSTVRVF